MVRKQAKNSVICRVLISFVIKLVWQITRYIRQVAISMGELLATFANVFVRLVENLFINVMFF